MPFTPKDWRDYPDTSTPITAAALEDLETRTTGYLTSLLAGSGMGVIIHGSDANVARGTDFKQYAWIGSVDPVNAATDDLTFDTTVLANFATTTELEYAYSSYKLIKNDWGYIGSALAANTFALSTSTANLPITSLVGGLVDWLDPADYAAGSRTVKYRLSVTLLTNNVAPAVTFTAGLYPVTAVAGANNVISATLGTVTSGSTVAFTSPAATSINHDVSTNFTAPAAGAYIIAVVTSGTTATNSTTGIRARLQMRQV